MIDEPLGFLLYNKFSVTVALVHIFLPYVVLVLYAGFAPVSPALLEPAQDLGANAFDRWRRVILPLVAAPAVSAFLLRLRPLRRGLRDAAVRRRYRRRAARRPHPGGVQRRSETGPLGAAPSLLMLVAFLLCYLLIGVRAPARCASTGIRFVVTETETPAQSVHRAVTLLALVFLFLPLVVVVLFSFHATGSLSFPFTGFSLRWYREVFDSEESSAHAL